MEMSSGRSPGINEGRWLRIERYRSVVVESEMRFNES